MTIPTALLAGSTVGFVLGYGLCFFIEWYRHRKNERILRALSGKLPDWEEQARALENNAHEYAMRGSHSTAKEMRHDADITRARGRHRDRYWV